MLPAPSLLGNDRIELSDDVVANDCHVESTCDRIATLGYLAWHLGPEGGDPVASGFDVAIVRNDVIAELYTVITK